MKAWLDHLMILPILLPLATGAFLLLFDDRRRVLKAGIDIASTLALGAIALALLVNAGMPSEAVPRSIGLYRLGDWQSPFGIVLVVDHLSALMVALTSVLALASLFYSLARWHRAGPHFHSLFQFLLMGLNGTFLTGDLFNLFVFFEVLLAASYGLVLHGSGPAKVKAGLHYIVVNLAASMLFLIGVSLLYGITGTLNMADLAVRIPTVAPSDRMLLEAGAAILGVAFLVKAGMWPLCFWLPTTYSAAGTPVSAIFAITSKVGVYILLRLGLLLFGEEAGASAGFGSNLLFAGGLATVAFGSIGILASQALSRIAGYSVLVSSGTLLAAFGLETPPVTAAALFYLVSSTMSLTAFFLLIELVERSREPGADVLAVTAEVFGDTDDEETPESEVGTSIPATVVILGGSFLACTLLLAGLPPLSGFIGKFAMLSAMLNPAGLGGGGEVSAGIWIFVALLIFSGLAALVALTRSGIGIFWAQTEGSETRIRVVEIAPVLALLALCLSMTVGGGAVMRYMGETAVAAHDVGAYVRRVLPTAARVGPAVTPPPASPEDGS